LLVKRALTPTRRRAQIRSTISRLSNTIFRRRSANKKGKESVRKRTPQNKKEKFQRHFLRRRLKEIRSRPARGRKHSEELGPPRSAGAGGDSKTFPLVNVVPSRIVKNGAGPTSL